MAMHVPLGGETPATRFNALAGAVNGPELFAVILEIVRPAPKPGRNFQNRIRGKALTNARKNRAEPLCRRTAPGRRPFFACLRPVVFHLLRRAADWQAALAFWQSQRAGQSQIIFSWRGSGGLTKPPAIHRADATLV